MIGTTLLLALCVLGNVTGDTEPVPPVPEANLSQLRLADFTDDELDIPFYLAHFHEVANSILLSGPERGFISLPVWRPKQFNKPFNARVLENYVTLAYFYGADRPWNPYYGHPAVRARLEALLEFWCNAQHPDGRFSEYKPEGWNLPATGFAVMFMGETLRLLHEGPPIDPELHTRVIAAHKKAITALLEQDALFNAGQNYSNQYSALWGGALAHLALYPDAALLERLEERLQQSLREHQSPAGHWYEGGGCDWPYTLRTHEGNILMAWHYARNNAQLAAPLIEGQTRWTEWRAFNAVPEPGSVIFVLNHAINTRTSGPYSTRTDAMGKEVPAARAFLPTLTEYQASLESKRQQLEQTWPRVPDLEVGQDHAYSPHIILNLTHHAWYPSLEERNEAMAKLPVFAAKRFNHQRCDSRNPQTYTFIRRPGYYAIFNAGRSLSPKQRFGLGLLWTDASGTLLQSQPDTQREAWGTRAEGNDNIYETTLPDAAFQVAETPVEPTPGPKALPEGDVMAHYALSDQGAKRMSFLEDRIEVQVEHQSPFVEQIPLLTPTGGKIVCEDASAHLISSDDRPLLTIKFTTPCHLTTQETKTTVAGKQLVVISCRGEKTLAYGMHLGS